MVAVVADTVQVDMVANTQQYDANMSRTGNLFERVMTTVAGEARRGTLAAEVVTGAVTGLSRAFVSVVNPVGLAIAGLSALGGVLAALFRDGENVNIKEMNKLIQDQEKIVKQLAATYGDLGKSVQTSVSESAKVLEVQSRTNILRLQEQAEQLQATFQRAFGFLTASIDPFTHALAGTSPEMLKFVGAFDALKASAASGEPDIRAFRNAISDIANADPNNASLQRMARQLLDASQSALDAEDAIKAAKRAIDDLGRSASAEAQMVRQLQSALSDLSKISLPRLDDRARAAQAYAEGLKNAVGSGQIAQVEAEYIAAIGRIESAEAAVEKKRIERENAQKARTAQRRAESKQNQIGTMITSRENEIRLMQQEIALLGMSRVERDKQRMILEAENYARRIGVELTEKQRQKVVENATAYAYLVEQERLANLELQNMAQLQELFGNTLIDGIQGAIDGTRSLNDVLADALKTLAKMALQAAILGQGPLTSFLGTTGQNASGIGGLVGAMFGGFRAGGGSVSGGRAYVVGEKGPEMFVPGRNGMIVPNSALSQGTPQGGANIILNNDFRDSSAQAIAATNARLDRLERNLPQIIQQTQRSQRLNQPFYGS